jgi:hypothetical protein
MFMNGYAFRQKFRAPTLFDQHSLRIGCVRKSDGLQSLVRQGSSKPLPLYCTIIFLQQDSSRLKQGTDHDEVEMSFQESDSSCCEKKVSIERLRRTGSDA